MKILQNVGSVLLLLVCGVMLSCSGATPENQARTSTGRGVLAKVLSNDFQVTSDATDQSEPSVAYDSVSHNRYLTAFVDGRNGSQIFANICTGADNPGQGLPGNVTSVTKTVTDFAITTAVGNKTQPKVAFFPNTADLTKSRYLVVWTDSRNGYGQIYGQLVTDAGVLDGGNFPISTHVDGQDISQSDPDLIYNAVTGKFVVAWVDTTTLDTDANPENIKTYVAAGQTFPNLSTHVSYIPIPQADLNMIRTAEVDPSSRAVTNVRAVTKEIFNGDYNDSGSAITESWMVWRNESHPKLSYSPISGEVFTAWSGTMSKVTLTIKYVLVTVTDPGPPPTSTVFANYLGATFSSVDQDNGFNRIKLIRNQGLGLVQYYSFGAPDTGSTFYGATKPALALDPNTNRMLIAWEDNNNGGTTPGKNLKGQLVDLTGFAAYGNVINVSNAVGDQTSPVAAFDNVNQRYFVAWEDARNLSANLTNIDIYSQFIDPQGNLSGGNSVVTVATGNQLAPAVAFGDVTFRKFFVVWKDGKTLGNSDIFGQMLEFSSAPQLVITDASDNPILNGSLDFASVNTGQSFDLTIKLRNDGNSPLVIQPPARPDAPFSIQTQTPTTINPGVAAGLTVRFAPIAAGSFNGNSGNNYKLTLDTNGGLSVLYFNGIGVGVNPLAITTTSLLDTTPTLSNYPATLATLAASGGVAPYVWSSTTLPAGLFLTPAGVLQQTGPISSGSKTITFTVTDGNTPATVATRTLTLNVGTLGITTTSLPTWTQGMGGYNTVLQSTGNAIGTITWSASSLPANLALDPTSGVIAGTPTAAGTFALLITLTDSSGVTVNSSLTKIFSLTINPTPTIITTSLPTGNLAVAYNQQVLLTGGTLPVTWQVTGALPPGLSFDTGTGVITGTPTSSGTYNFTVQVTDAVGKVSNSRTLSLVVNDALGISTQTTGVSAPLNALISSPYTLTLTGAGGTAPYSWSIVAGSLPTGLSLNPFTGIVSGSPTTLGTFTYNVQLADNAGSKAVKTFNTSILATLPTALSVVTVTLPAGTTGTAYSQTEVATGGTTPYTWSITSGTLPAGLTLNATTGSITGTPTTAVSNAAFTVQVSDATAATATQAQVLTINDAGGVTPGGGTTDLGSNVPPPSSGGKSGCFIATAAYGSYLDPQVMVLRHFRDDVLLQSGPGTAFVKFYYQHSPPIADFIRQHESLRLLTRWALTPLIFSVKYPLAAGALLFFGLFVLIRRQLRLRKVAELQGESLAI
jgi:hypothetical protein